MEEIQTEFDFTTGNGKPKGNSGGRPTKEFLEAKRAIEGLDALERTFGAEFTAQLVSGLASKQGRTKKSGIGDIRRTAEDVVSSPLVEPMYGEVASIFGKVGGVVGLIFGLWEAEEHLKIPIRQEGEPTEYIPFPPILHTIVDILTSILVVIQNLDQFLEGIAKTDIKKVAAAAEKGSPTAGGKILLIKNLGKELGKLF